jgi:hypothetical protein
VSSGMKKIKKSLKNLQAKRLNRVPRKAKKKKRLNNRLLPRAKKQNIIMMKHQATWRMVFMRYVFNIFLKLSSRKVNADI